MPRTVRKRAARPGSDRDLPPVLLTFLETGEYPDDADDALDIVHDEGGKRAWERWRATILSEWKSKRPGSRPWAWYQFDCPPRAERLKTSGSGKESVVWNSSDHTWAYRECSPDNPPRIESEATFLRRLALLLPGEEERIGRKDWQPVKLDVDSEGWAHGDTA